VQTLQIFETQLNLPRALTEERQANLKLNVLREYVQRLRRKGRKFEQTRIDTQDSATTNLDAYAKASCRQLCDDIYNRFPREVRDMIYGHLNLPGTKKLGNAAASVNGPTYFHSHSEAHWHRFQWRDCPENHWWKIDFVGEHFRRELSEHYYRSNLFFFGDSFDLLSKFRVTDQWNLGFVPADVVTNVGVQIDCDGYDFDGLTSLQDPSPNNDVWGGATSNRRKPHSTLLSSLDQLSGFKKGTKVSIKFVVDNSGRDGTAGEVQQWLCDTVLPIVLPGVQRLISAGYVIHVVLAKTASWDDDDIVNEDFIFAGKTFEQDTIQSTLDIVGL
jgi:hypothetical protein